MLFSLESITVRSMRLVRGEEEFREKLSGFARATHEDNAEKCLYRFIGAKKL